MAMLLRFIIQWLFQRLTVRTVQAQTHLFALKALETVRKGLLGIILGVLFLQIVAASILGALITGIYLLPLDFDQKILVLFCSFLGVIVLGGIALAVGLSGRLWLRAAREYTHRPHR